MPFDTQVTIPANRSYLEAARRANLSLPDLLEQAIGLSVPDHVWGEVDILSIALRYGRKSKVFQCADIPTLLNEIRRQALLWALEMPLDPTPGHALRYQTLATYIVELSRLNPALEVKIDSDRLPKIS